MENIVVPNYPEIDLTKYLANIAPTAYELHDLETYGHSYGLLIKDIYRFTLESLFSELSSCNLLTAENVDYIVENWQALLQPECDSELSYCCINAYYLALEHFQKQISTLLGETLQIKDYLEFFPEVAGNDAINAYMSEVGATQKHFTYELSPAGLTAITAGAQRRYELSADSERELVEWRNLQFLQQQSENPEHEFFVEVSPPIYSWQSELMVRCYQTDHNGGWIINQFALPNIAPEFEHHYTYTTCETTYKPNEMLASVLGFDDQEELIAFMDQNLHANKLGGAEVISQASAFVKSTIAEKLLPRFQTFGTNLVGNIFEISKDQTSLAEQAELIAQAEAASRLQFTSTHELAKRGLNQNDIDLIRSNEFINNSLSSNFNSYVNKSFSTQSLYVPATDSHCQRIKDISFGNKTSDAPQISIGKDGTKLEWVSATKPNGETVTVLKHCPVCGAKNLDPCDDSCRNCKTDTQLMRQLYEKGELADYKNKLKQPKNTPQLDKARNNESGPSAGDSIIDSVLTLQWMRY